MADFKVLRYIIDFGSASLCNKIGSGIYNVLRQGIPMVRFQYDGKRKKNEDFFFFFVEMSNFFAKISARDIYWRKLIFNYKYIAE